MAFGETVTPLAAIQAILHDYPYSASIFREFIQNSDDARATKQIFVLDKGKDPALLAYNDAEFGDDDWKAIQSIHQSSKRQDTSKIGKYGVGFRACYHITDVPQILSGDSFAILDPLHSGVKIRYDEFINTDHHNHFNFFPDISESTSFHGTVIRLPLRSSPSELSQRIVHVGELRQMIKEYISEELNISLLFLDNINTIEIWETDSVEKNCLAIWTKSEKIPAHQSEESPFATYDSVLSNGVAQFSWRIVQSQYPGDDARSRLDGEDVDHIFQKHKLRPDVRLAYPLSSDEYTSGRLFTFLPLPSKTNFPVHIHALFALMSSRQGLRNSKETGIVSGTDNDVLIRWNKLLFDYYIPQAWCYLLKTLADGRSCKDIYSAWPPYLSSITSGDGLYWQNIISKIFDVVIQSGSTIWPSVSAQDTTYVDLKSSLVVTKGEVDLDVLAALDHLGLTIVQLPKDHMRLLDSSITKLTPGSAHGSLERHGKEISQKFESLSMDQKRILFKYLLSEKDLRHVYGLPLLPTLSGSYISLNDRKTCSLQHYIALTSEEAEVFKSSASDAIPLAELDLEIVTLIREKATIQANVDLLTPQVIVTYLSNELDSRSDDSLTKFWSWLSEWHHKDEMMGLFKDNYRLRLIPTSKGPQPVSSLIFQDPFDKDSAQLFEKIGLAFISAVLPPPVVKLLNHHGVVKDTRNLDDFLAAINLNAFPPLSDSEAKSIFDHVTVHYRLLNDFKKLKKLPVFPILIPRMEVQGEELSNTSVEWRGIDDITIRGISPMKLVPLVGNVHFLDKDSIMDPSCSLLKSLQIHVLKDEDILLFALEHFPSLSKSLEAAYISYIQMSESRNRLSQEVKLVLGKSKFVPTSDGTLQSPQDLIDPESHLRRLFPLACEDRRIPKYEDDYDRKIFNNLRTLKLTKMSLTSDLIKERISYISTNSSSSLAVDIARSLVSAMNDPNFLCSDLSIDPNMRWLPTQAGLVGSKKCIHSGRHDSDLFDEVLTVLEEPETFSPSFKALMGWDKPVPSEVLMEQLDLVLSNPNSETCYGKVCGIVRELASRDLGPMDIESIGEVVGDRSWVPTKSGILVPHSRAVFTTVSDTGCFYEIEFSKSEKQIRQFLSKMGCHDLPTAAAIIRELNALRTKVALDKTVFGQAVQLLEMLPDLMTDQERESLLVPTRTGNFVSVADGVYYYKGGGISETEEKPIAHYLVNRALAEKLRLRPLGFKNPDDDIDLGGKPITIIRNTLRQYDPKQFFTEFIANASDAMAKRFSILVDHHQGPTENLVSEGLAVFQSPSLVVHNDGVFTWNDFKGILQTGIGGKRGREGMIGHFGLGALSMFHFTEIAMIVSGEHVLFISPSKRNLSFCDKHYIIFDLHEVKRLYADHLKPLSGLFGFDINSDKPYEGTLFRLPLRNERHQNDDSILTTVWDIDEVQDMFLNQFDNLAYKSLLFTGLGRIDVFQRKNSDIEELRSIHCDREHDVHLVDNSGAFQSETVTFKATGPGPELPQWYIVSMRAGIPQNYKDELAKKYGIDRLLPVRIAATLDSAHISKTRYNLFCSLPLPVTTSLPVHISAPLILEQERRNIRLDSDRLGIESKYNEWLLSTEVPRLYLYLLERLFRMKNTNAPWWPTMPKRDSDLAASRIFMEAFWSPEVLGKCTRHVFASKYDPNMALSPGDAVLFSEKAYRDYRQILIRILSIAKPMSVAKVPGKLFEYTTAITKLRSVNATFIKSLLESGDWSNGLTMDEIKILMSYLSREKVSLDGLPLLPLVDGSYATIQSKSQSIKTYYKFETALAATTLPFKRDYFVHEDFKAYEYLLDKDYNVSCLSEAEIIELVEESIKPAREFSGDEEYRALVSAFWDAQLNVDPVKLSHLPLIPTLRPSHFISLDKINDSSTIVVKSPSSSDKFDYRILQRLGMRIIVSEQLPKALRTILKERKESVYHNFLNYMQESYMEKLQAIQQLVSSDRQELRKWILSKISSTRADEAWIVCKLPAWSVKQRIRTEQPRLACLDDVVILPSKMPSDILLPFTNQPIVDWDSSMLNVKKKRCSAMQITQILSVSRGNLLRTADRTAYKRFLEHILTFDKISDYKLLAPNEGWVLTPVDELYERDDLFVAAFKAQPGRLLPDDFQDLARSLSKYGLKRRRDLDLEMFIKCAKAFDSDRKSNRPTRSKTLYACFNNLPLVHWRDIDRCSELDKLKFIPRVDASRAGYDGIDTNEYRLDLPDILSPSEIVLPQYESICWSQRGWTDPPPNPTLCGTYKSLGQPSGREVIEHLKVLAEIGQKHGYCPALLSDLKKTYKWLNDHVSQIRTDILQENSTQWFLNVDKPDSDEWIWHSALNIVMDLQDVQERYDAKEFLRNYNDLLEAAGVRKIRNAAAKPVVVTNKTSFYRVQFNNMRLNNCDVNVVFNARDDQCEILPAHRTWLSANSSHFWTIFLPDAAGFQETRQLGLGEHVTINVADYSSHCVKEVVDWMYTGTLPDSIVVKSNDNDNDPEGSAKLELALDMLSLAHYWQVTELHEHMQKHIINTFINPYTVRTIREHARERAADELLNECDEYERDNREIIDEISEV